MSKERKLNSISPRGDIRTAVLVDGGFFIRRYNKVFKNANNHSAETIIENFYRMVKCHIRGEYLYRIIYYDCAPFQKKMHNPISGKSIDYSKSNLAIQRNEIFTELKKRRKVAIRLGELKEQGGWNIHPKKKNQLLKKQITMNDITEDDVIYGLVQKGVDIKIGIDIASLAYKRLVDKIILISGDSDFVPAAKLARREGIDFILDPMRQNIDPTLWEHIDGLKCACPKDSKTQKGTYFII